jgi:hypothetical protein
MKEVLSSIHLFVSLVLAVPAISEAKENENDFICNLLGYTDCTND